MNLQATLAGKVLGITLTPRAEAAMARREVPLHAELELYFSCLVRKQVRFRDVGAAPVDEAVKVADNLFVCFRPVMTRGCSIDNIRGETPPSLTSPLPTPALSCPAGCASTTETGAGKANSVTGNNVDRLQHLHPEKARRRVRNSTKGRPSNGRLFDWRSVISINTNLQGVQYE